MAFASKSNKSDVVHSCNQSILASARKAYIKLFQANVIVCVDRGLTVCVAMATGSMCGLGTDSLCGQGTDSLRGNGNWQYVITQRLPDAHDPSWTTRFPPASS